MVSKKPETTDSQGPLHVSIIMDGNGRWAQERGLPRTEGHRRGVDNLHQILRSAFSHKLRYLTVYAFSSENWLRPKAEVDMLMRLLASSLKKYTKDLVEQKIRLHTIGRVEELPASVRKELDKAKRATADFTDYHFTIALNYGSRLEIVDAVKRYTAEVQSGNEAPENLNWETLSRYLDTRNLPDPDLFIRTSGELRTSNFLLMQSAYSEMYFTPTYWPDFGPERFAEAIAAYQHRERRYGMTGEQVNPHSSPVYGF
ncbi:MAG: isoprenyl transferase [Opitutales bacterium]